MQYLTFSGALPSVRNHYQKSIAALASGVLATGLLLGASAASAATFTLEELKTDDLSFASGGMLFSNWDIGAGGVNAENILIVTIDDPGSVGGFILRSTNDELSATGTGIGSDFTLEYSYDVSVIGAGPGDPGIVSATLELLDFTTVLGGQLAGFTGEDGSGLDLWFSQNVTGLPDRTVDTDPLLLSPTSLSIVASVGGQSVADGSIAAIDEYSTSFSVSAIPVPAAAWLFGSGLLGLIGIARRKKTA